MSPGTPPSTLMPIQLSLVGEYRNTDVLDLSADGRRMLGYSQGRIAVLDLPKGDVVAHWKIGSWPTFGQFLPEGNRVFYGEAFERHRITSVEDPSISTVCSVGPFEPVDDGFAIATQDDREAETFLFVRVSLQDCSIAREVDPQVDARERIAVQGYVASRSAGRFAYLAHRFVEGQDYTRVTEAWVRDASSLQVVSLIDYQQGWKFDELTFTPNGSQVVIRGHEWRPDLSRDEAGYRFFFFDASSGALVRTFDSADATSGLAISPDGRFLATASRETELRKGKRYIRISAKLYDFYSGQELARGDFPWRKEPSYREKISWGGSRVGFLNFSPDGKKLYASSKDTRVWDIPEALIQRTASQAKPDDSPPRSTASSPPPPPPQRAAEKSEEEEEVSQGDRCYVYAVDVERGRELVKDLAKIEAMSEEEQKALASQVEKHFEPFSPEMGEEELTTQHYQLPFAEGVITASVYYTDESTAVEVGGRSAVLETMMLCVVLADGEEANACEAEGGAVAETAAGYALKNRIMTRAERSGRKYIVGMVCERPSAIESMMNGASATP